MKTFAKRGIVGGIVGAAAAVITLTVGSVGGCAERVLRENVLASTQSTVGLSLAQNPASQLYELKAGYARSEFFLVPTGKLVGYDAEGAEKDIAGACHDPTPTPDVIAEIQVGGRGKQTLATGEQGAEIQMYQRLAVGTNAVRAPAAVALMANHPDSIRALSSLAPTAGSNTELVALRTEIGAMVTSDAAKKQKALEWLAANQAGHPARGDIERFVNEPPGASDEEKVNVLKRLRDAINVK
ncbi:MAG TPA: hypothetical protein VG797_01065 [Phycisphaerales bacterium]|nr:hypothetical protein [Phycisphaerales bacterium]